eukprot:2209969-Alexandrium_andersonii.AAC.1
MPDCCCWQIVVVAKRPNKCIPVVVQAAGAWALRGLRNVVARRARVEAALMFGLADQLAKARPKTHAPGYASADLRLAPVEVVTVDRASLHVVGAICGCVWRILMQSDAGAVG